MHASFLPSCWSLPAKAGLPRYAEIICIADDAIDSAVGCTLPTLMGFPDVEVMVSWSAARVSVSATTGGG